eukprot:scaffold1554_cov401-Prasinococcus_capsulatus_cf.AAC.19
MGAAASTHPLDTLKVRMQLSGQGLSPLQVFTNIARTEGLNGLYTGLSASMTRQLVYSGTRFMAYDAMKDILQTPGEKNLPAYKKVIAGCSAGAIGATVGNPADLALVRMQADGKLPEHLRRNYRGISDVILRTVRQEGPLSLWRGCGPTVNRAMIVTTSQLATYDQAKELLINFGADPHATSTHLTASITSGIVASCVSNPVDLAKTRLMSMQPLPDGSMPYKGMFDVMQKMVAEEVRTLPAWCILPLEGSGTNNGSPVSFRHHDVPDARENQGAGRIDAADKAGRASHASACFPFIPRGRLNHRRLCPESRTGSTFSQE